MVVDEQQHAARRFGDVGEPLDDPLLQRRAVALLAPDRVGEAGPFAAIIVAMLEDMLGDEDAGRARALADVMTTSATAVIRAISTSSAARPMSPPIRPAIHALDIIAAK